MVFGNFGPPSSLIFVRISAKFTPKASSGLLFPQLRILYSSARKSRPRLIIVRDRKVFINRSTPFTCLCHPANYEQRLAALLSGIQGPQETHSPPSHFALITPIKAIYRLASANCSLLVLARNNDTGTS